MVNNCDWDVVWPHHNTLLIDIRPFLHYCYHSITPSIPIHWHASHYHKTFSISPSLPLHPNASDNPYIVLPPLATFKIYCRRGPKRVVFITTHSSTFPPPIISHPPSPIPLTIGDPLWNLDPNFQTQHESFISGAGSHSLCTACKSSILKNSIYTEQLTIPQWWVEIMRFTEWRMSNSKWNYIMKSKPPTTSHHPFEYFGIWPPWPIIFFIFTIR